MTQSPEASGATPQPAATGIRVAASATTLGIGVAVAVVGFAAGLVLGDGALPAVVVGYDVVAVVLLVLRGASPGQLVLGLVAVGADGRPAGGRALLKAVLMAVTGVVTAGIGLVAGLLVKESGTNRHAFDRLAGVSVVRGPVARPAANRGGEARVLAPSSAFLAGAPLGEPLVHGAEPVVVPPPPPTAVPPSPVPSTPVPSPPAPPVRVVLTPEPDAMTTVHGPPPQLIPTGPPPPPAPTATPRPWTLVLDQGAILPIDRAWVFGRQPTAPANAPDAEPYPIPDASMSLSKTHFAVLPRPGGAAVVDLHSTNGVSITTPDGVTLVLQPGTPTDVAVGSTVSFGQRSLEVRG